MKQHLEYSKIDLTVAVRFRLVGFMNYDNKGVTDAVLGDAAPKLTLLTSLCGSGTCPTVYRTDRGTLVVQGYSLTPQTAGIDVPAGEQLVEIPADLLAAAIRASE